MRIHVIARDIQRHDAVGNLCRQFQRFLVASGHDARLAAENCHPDDRGSIREISRILAECAPDDPLIFHYSTHDPSFERIARLPNPKVLYFHNITPEQFFAGFDPRAMELAGRGMAQRPLAGHFDVLMANSRTSAQVLLEGLATAERRRFASDIVVCPPVIGVDRWASIASRPVELPADKRFVLYVGRLVPSKGIHNLLLGFAVLAARDPSVDLIVVGSPANGAYVEHLKATAGAPSKRGVQRVHFFHGVDDDVVRFLYERAAVCASMSEHEGFGVPILDALVFGKTLVIRDEPGMVETAAGAAIVVSHTAPETVAAALATALDDHRHHGEFAAARTRRLEQFRKLCDGHLLLQGLEATIRRHRARLDPV